MHTWGTSKCSTCCPYPTFQAQCDYGRSRKPISGAGLRRMRAGRCGVGLVRCCKGTSADWDKEMDAYRKRTLKPNQLATLRQMEADNGLEGQVQ